MVTICVDFKFVERKSATAWNDSPLFIMYVHEYTHIVTEPFLPFLPSEVEPVDPQFRMYSSALQRTTV